MIFILFKPDSELAEVVYVLYESSFVSTFGAKSSSQDRDFSEKGFGESIPTGFLVYQSLKQLISTAFKANYVPVGPDQKPMIEQTH